MERAFLESQLTLAEEHLAHWQESIKEKRAILARHPGSPRAVEAQVMLHTFEALLAMQTEVRDRLARQLTEFDEASAAVVPIDKLNAANDE